MTLIPAGIYMRKGTTQPGIVDNSTVTNPKVVHSPTTAAQTRAPGLQLTYNDDPAEGTLFVSVSPVETDDGYGNNVPEGVGVFGSTGQQIVMQVVAGNPQVLFNTGSADQVSAGVLTMGVEPNAGDPYLYTILQSPISSSQGDYCYIALNSAPVPASFDAGGDLIYMTTSGQQQAPLTWGASATQVRPTDHTGDDNVYRCERATLNFNASSITSTSYTQISPTWTLGTGNYHIRGQIEYSPDQAAGNAAFTFGDSGLTVADMHIIALEWAIPAPGTSNGSLTNGNASTINALDQVFNSSTFGAADRIMHIDGTFDVTVSGSIGLFAACGVANDTYGIYGYGSYLEFFPF